jgi:hypothetical protein
MNMTEDVSIHSCADMHCRARVNVLFHCWQSTCAADLTCLPCPVLAPAARSSWRAQCAQHPSAHAKYKVRSWQREHQVKICVCQAIGSHAWQLKPNSLLYDRAVWLCICISSIWLCHSFALTLTKSHDIL